MPLVPKIVGSIQIRERTPRYEGEPRHKRLDFIRPKRIKESEWALVPVTTAKRYVLAEVPAYQQQHEYSPTVYQPQYPQYNQVAYEQPHQQLDAHAHYEDVAPRWHQYEPHHNQAIPVPPHHGQQHLAYQAKPQAVIEDRPAVIDLGPANENDDDIMFSYVEPQPKRRQSKARVVQSKSIPRVRFPKPSSVSSVDTDDTRRRPRHHPRLRSRPSFDYDSDDSLAGLYRREGRR